MDQDLPAIAETPPPDEPKSGEPRFKWQDGFGVAGVLLAVGGMTDMPLTLRIACLVACAICLPISFSSHRNWPVSIRWGLSIGIALLMAYMSWRTWEKSSEHIPTAQENAEATAKLLHSPSPTQDQHGVGQGRPLHPNVPIPVPRKHGEQPKDRAKQPQTLSDLFRTDFPNLASVSDDGFDL